MAENSTLSTNYLGRVGDKPSMQAKPPKPKMSTEEAKDIHAEAMRLCEEAWTAERQNIREGRDDQKFYAGGEGQWEPKARQSRVNEGRPVLTVNRLPQFVRQMTGDLRKNPPGLKFLPAKGEASKETAEAFNGITRHIEQQSNAKDCYIIATENAAITGQGFFRALTEYSADDGFDLDIRIKPVRDPFGALLDPYSTLPDKSDIRYGFVFEHISASDFKEMWPDHDPVNIKVPEQNAYPWRVGDSIVIAEFWKRKPVKKTIIVLDNGKTVDDEAEIPPDAKEVRRRDVDGHEVCYYLVTGADVLSGPHVFPSKYIPIFMVVGEEITMDGTTIRKGMVRDAKDPQRIYNYSRTASVEALALQPKAPFIGTVAMFKGLEKFWKTAGTKVHAFLPFNVDPKAAGLKPERSPPAIASQGMDQQSLIAADDMKAVTGMYDASLGAKSNESSGVAIAQRQQEGDTTTYLYPDNLSRALSAMGRCFADMIPRVMDTERQVRILKEDGGTEMIMVNTKTAQPETDVMGQPKVDAQGNPRTKPLYDLSAGEYDVVVSTGPNFASRRAEARAHMIEMAAGVPMVGQVAADIIAENSDFPGSDKLAARLRKAMGIGDDGEPINEGQPDPAKQAEVAKNAAGAAKDAATTDKLVAETEGIKLTNAQMFIQMQAFMAQLPQIMTALDQLTKGGQPAAPAQPSPPEMPMPVADAPPPEAIPAPAGADLPLVEVETL